MHSIDQHDVYQGLVAGGSRDAPDDTLVIVLPEFVARHWWEHVLHNQTALRLKAALLFHPGVIVASVPYHLAH